MLRDFVEESTNAPGTGATVQLLGAPAGRATWLSRFASGSSAFYVLTDNTQWEVGEGTVASGSPPTLTRPTVVLANSAGTTARLNFTSAARAYNWVPAARMPFLRPDDTMNVPLRALTAPLFTGTAAGTADALTTSPTPALTALAAGITLRFLVGLANTGAATLNVSGLGASPLRDAAGRPLLAGELVPGLLVEVMWTGSEWRLVGSIAARGRIIGEYIELSTPQLPPGCLWPDGSNVSRTVYAEYFARVGTTYGAGDGSTTFGLPDRRGRLGLARDDLGGTAANRITAGECGINGTVLGAAGGDQRLPAHGHAVSDPGHAHGGATQNAGSHTHVAFVSPGTGVASGPGSNGAGTFSGNTNAAGDHTHTIASGTTGVTVQSAGAGTGANVPPCLVCNVALWVGV